MMLQRKSGLVFVQFPALKAYPELLHGVFTRLGGTSRGAQESLNVSYGVGDGDTQVKQNRRQIAQCLGADRLVFARQRHGRRVWAVRDGAGREESSDVAPPIADAMVTDRAGHLLVIQVADCQPVFIFDPHRGVVANIHSGWRGSLKNVIGRTVEAMSREYDCRPANMVAAIGPSLGPCCAEFIHYRTEIPPDFWRYKDNRDHFDFWAVSKDQLVEAGLSASKVIVSGHCTRCRTDLFYSYRGEGETGRFAAVIGLR